MPWEHTRQNSFPPVFYFHVPQGLCWENCFRACENCFWRMEEFADGRVWELVRRWGWQWLLRNEDYSRLCCCPSSRRSSTFSKKCFPLPCHYHWNMLMKWKCLKLSCLPYFHFHHCIAKKVKPPRCFLHRLPFAFHKEPEREKETFIYGSLGECKYLMKF